MDNYSGLNISTGLGDGLAQVAKFSKTDHAINQLYQQQQQRQQAGYSDYLSTQKELDKELANVRSADVPELRSLYDTQKQLHQQLLFNPKLQKDRNAYSEVEKAYQDANMKLLQGIHGSVETQAFDKSLNEDMVKNSDAYNDDARTVLSKAMQLPNSQRLKLGYNSVEPYLWQGGNYDWQKSIKDAQGTQRDYFGKEMPSPDGLSYVTPSFKGLANPAQFQQSLIGDLAQRKAGKSAQYEYSQLTPEQIDAVNKSYEKIPQSEFDKWGITKPNLDISNPDNKAAQYVSYLSKLYAVNNIPTMGETKSRENKGAVLQAQLQNEKTMEGVRQGNRVSLAKLKEQYRQADKQSQENFVNGYVENKIQESQKNKPLEINYPNGQKETSHKLNLSAPELKMFQIPATDGSGKSVQVNPDEVRVGKNNDLIALFYKTDANGNKIIKNGGAVIDDALTTRFNKQTANLIWSKYFGSSSINKQMSSDDGNDDENDNDVDDNTPVQTSTKQTSSYTNITETNKGTIGVKNGKWYDIKTGKPIQ